MKIKSTVAAVVLGTSLLALAGPIQAGSCAHEGWHHKQCHHHHQQMRPAATWGEYYSSGHYAKPVGGGNMWNSWMFWNR